MQDWLIVVLLFGVPVGLFLILITICRCWCKKCRFHARDDVENAANESVEPLLPGPAANAAVHLWDEHASTIHNERRHLLEQQWNARTSRWVSRTYQHEENHQRAESQNLQNQILGQQRSSDKTIDLHNLTVGDAMHQFIHLLQAVEKEYHRSHYNGINRFVYVITGRGLHSKGGTPKIKPAVQRYLDKHGYTHKWENSGGLVIVDLVSKRRFEV